MTVRVSKPAFNVRDKLSELDKPVGMKGSELMRSETTEDVRNLINSGRKNIMINGAMNVAQRGTSISVEGYACDRWNYLRSGVNEELTFSQSSLTSSDLGPWGAGFRNCLKIQNGNQTGGAGSNDYGIARYKIEAQDLANCGWDYTSSTSYITFSYWIKSSVPQNFYQYMRSHDGTAKVFAWETGTLIKDVWKKVVVTLPGDSGMTINDDNGIGMMITIPVFWGGTWTDNGVELGKWRTWDTNLRVPDYDGTWWTTDDATLEFTGVQLEVGSQATSFEFRHYGEELALCQRYYQKIDGTSDLTPFGFGRANGTAQAEVGIPLTVPLAKSPDLTCANNSAWGPSSSSTSSDAPTVQRWTAGATVLAVSFAGHSGLTNGRVTNVHCASSSNFEMDAEP